MYTVHTTAHPEAIADETRRIAIQGTDCFYGWGEEREEDCPQHSIVIVETLAEANDVADTMLHLEEEVVVTASHDWSQVVTTASTPIFYRASHSH